MSASRFVLLPALLLTSLLVPVVELAGQAVVARALLVSPQSSVRVAGVTTRANGVWSGLALEVDAGRFSLSASATRGRLAASQTGSVPESDGGEMSLVGRYQVRPWLDLRLDYAARAFSSAAGYQRWNMVGVGAVVSRDLGTPAVRAFVSLTYLPVVTVSNVERPSLAVGSQVGISLAPDRLPIVFMLSYRVERFSFPTAAARSEQLDVLTVSVGVRAQRSRGR